MTTFTAIRSAIPLEGDPGSDWLNGDPNNGTLVGQGGNDILLGGEGQEVLTGGRGIDMFVFQIQSDVGDRITDFNVKKDLLDLRPIFALPSFAGGKVHELHSELIQAVQDGSDAQIQLDADGLGSGQTFVTLVTLQNTNAVSLGCGNYVL